MRVPLVAAINNISSHTKEHTRVVDFYSKRNTKMVDVEHRPGGSNRAHIAGLKRLSARAASIRNSLHSFDNSDPPILRKQRSVAEKHSVKFSFPTFSRWSLDAAVERRRRSQPEWVEGYMGKMVSVLRDGGWSETDITEMVSGSVLGSGSDALVLKEERFSDSLRKSGWSFEEVSYAFGFDLRPGKGRRPTKKV